MEDVETFTYFGSGVGTTLGTEKDIKARIGKARGFFVLLNKILKDMSISLNTKFIIVNFNVKYVLYYWCKTTLSCIKKLQTFVNGCLRNILRIMWTG